MKNAGFATLLLPGLQDGIQLRILDPVTPENKGQHILEEVERLEAVAKEGNLTMRLANRAGAFADYLLAGGHPYDGWRLQYWKEVGRVHKAQMKHWGVVSWLQSMVIQSNTLAAADCAPACCRPPASCWQQLSRPRGCVLLNHVVSMIASMLSIKP